MDVLIYADTLRSADLRHVVPIAIGDAFPYAEHRGRAFAFVSSTEEARVSELGGLEVVGYADLGLADLLEQGFTHQSARLELLARACRTIQLEDAAVPPDFPLAAAARLQREGIRVEPAGDLFATRRRSKSAREIEGIRQAQAATHRALEAIRDRLRAGGSASSESLRAAAREAVAADAVLMEYMIVAHGPQSASPHEDGYGAIERGEPVVVDLGVRDAKSGCWADMTRTFCIGAPPEELVEYHDTCREVLERVTPEVRPGVNCAHLHRLADEIIAARGYPTMLTAGVGSSEGFFHALGHGVGLEIHEAPTLGPSGEDLLEGDVVTIEPGVYRQGFGGCRLEDLVLVTASGCEVSFRMTSSEPTSLREVEGSGPDLRSEERLPGNVIAAPQPVRYHNRHMVPFLMSRRDISGLLHSSAGARRSWKAGGR